MKTKLNEMAIALKDYKKRIDGHRLQLVENWCLCKYCQLYAPACATFGHWKGELKAHINELKTLKLKNDGIDLHKTVSNMLIRDYDFKDINVILKIIESKFDDENINDLDMQIEVARQFTESVTDLINVIIVDKYKTNDYMEKTFGPSVPIATDKPDKMNETIDRFQEKRDIYNMIMSEISGIVWKRLEDYFKK